MCKVFPELDTDSLRFVQEIFPFLSPQLGPMYLSSQKYLMELKSISAKDIDRTLLQLKPFVEVFESVGLNDDIILLDYAFLIQKLLAEKSMVHNDIPCDVIFRTHLEKLVQFASDPKNAVVSLQVYSFGSTLR